MGQWQTVSVTVLDEVEENDRRQQSQIDVVLAEERAEKDQVSFGLFFFLPIMNIN